VSTKCTHILKHPKLSDFYKAFNWYIKLIEAKAKAEGDVARREAVKRQRQKEREERLKAESEYKRKKKELKDMRALKMKEFIEAQRAKREEALIICPLFPPLSQRYHGRIRKAKCHPSREALSYTFGTQVTLLNLVP
jgi:hypothetical protein